MQDYIDPRENKDELEALKKLLPEDTQRKLIEEYVSPETQRRPEFEITQKPENTGQVSVESC